MNFYKTDDTNYAISQNIIGLEQKFIAFVKLPRLVHCPEKCQVHGRWNQETASKMAKGSGTKWHICG
ncbi:hypothetical protein WH47_07632 [Habropoda laboriosa]|uniref:Uncharacterized protein n=1 Tax=Habropoda laboriosa TaxID=597456 RepID=A0A0L7REL3_9HYME|nr:hypothetical protein WH47_07632 [Habropoda laboriosa]